MAQHTWFPGWTGPCQPPGKESASLSPSVVSGTHCDSVDCSPPGPSVHGILQARMLECAAIASRRSSQTGDQTRVSYAAGRFLTV